MHASKDIFYLAASGKAHTYQPNAKSSVSLTFLQIAFLAEHTRC